MKSPMHRYQVLLIAFLLILMVTIFPLKAAFASAGAPVGSCPPGFELHPFMEHDGEHMHQHIGLDVDLNGDGYICMKMITEVKHLHVDNSLPLK